MLQKLVLSVAIGCISAMAATAIAQPDHGVISVRRAYYGSSEESPSRVVEVTPAVADRCNGKESCTFKCSAHDLKVYNPYPSHPKECTISFYCGPGALQTNVFSAGTQVALSCSPP
jgi:hypothetical protein